MPNINELNSHPLVSSVLSYFRLPTIRFINRVTKYAPLTASLFAFAIYADVAHAQDEEVPVECAELYLNNGAIPGDANCEYLASTVSVGLGNYYCRTFSGARYVELYCDSPLPSSTPWVDLDILRNNYQQEKMSASPDTGFAHQFLCIAETSCANFDAQGESGWAGDFVKFLFDYMDDDNGLPASVEIDCPSFLNNDWCFEYKGHTQHGAELLFGFYAYCFDRSPIIDYERWDSDHSTFLEKGVTACFDQVIAVGDLDGVWAPRITVPAAGVREGAQLDCRVWNFIRTGGRETGNEPVKNLASLRFAGAQGFMTDVLVPEELRKPAPKRVDYFNPAWEAAGDLSVVVSDQTFFVKPGDQVVISASLALEDGTQRPLDSSDVTFQLLNNTQHASITDEGILTANSVVTPFSTYTDASVVLVAVSVGEQFGIGQVMIIDDDTDGDVLLDSYEDSAGLDKLNATDVLDDNDGNGKAALFDAIAYSRSSLATLPDPDLPSIDSDSDNSPNATGTTDVVVQRKSGGGSVSLLFVLLIVLQVLLRVRKPLLSSDTTKHLL